MPHQETETLWQKRLNQIDSDVQEIRFPQVEEDTVSQDEETCEVVMGDQALRIRFHDYDEVYKIPGLYEKLFYEELRCCSPSRVAGLLDDVLEDSDSCPEDLRVLDVGAGNGMVGEELLVRGVRKIVGIDIIKEAREAARRDRPEVYDDYHVTDLTDLPERVEEKLREDGFNCLSTVAALGFGDIPPKAFVKALDVIETPGWLAFNIKEDFLSERDSTGFCRLIRRLSRDQVIQIQAYRRYRHRISVTGEPLHYVAMVAKKLKDVPDHYLED
ncbi:MAG: methyltransferase domain-containing protein [Phycisphaerae bacterium]|nr:methyltransferase domain-containing protein [Phycisphaerae bacterium]